MAKKTKKMGLPASLLKKTQPSQPGRSGVSSWQNLLQQASLFQQAGRLTEAEALCQQILSSDPTHPEALHFLGMLAHQAGRNDIAVDLVSRALKRKPDDVGIYYNLGFLLLTNGRTEEAVGVYKRLLALQPGHVEAHNNLGNAYLQLGELDQAANCFRKAISLKPDFIDAHNNLGITLKAQGKLNEALSSFRRTLALKPDYAKARTNLGNTYLDLGQLDEAANCFREALTLNPQLVEAHFLLGKTLGKQKKTDEALACFERTLNLEPNHFGALTHLGVILQEQGNFDEALMHFRQALAFKPDSAEAYYNLGLTLHEMGKLEEAVANYRQALTINPDDAKTLNNLGYTLRTQFKLDEAVACYHRALSLQPDFVKALNNLGFALHIQTKLEEAIACFRQALALQPDFAWAHLNLLFCMNYLPQSSQEEIYQQSLQWQEQVAGRVEIAAPDQARDKNPDRRLRIGYVSADFNNHSVAYFIEPVLVAHDRTQFEVYCYANVGKPDERTERLRTQADRWRSIVAESDQEAAALIARDRIDILVDLGGHTRGNRLLVFARKPSPIQMTWLGYPNTTGMRTIDYRLTDEVADPPGEADELHSEKLIRLEHGFLCYQPDATAPEVQDPPCLATEGVTYGSFNNLAKVTAEVVEVWAEILRRQPGSRLLLKAKALADAGVKDRYLRLFAELGIAAERLELYAWLPDIGNHLELYHRLDIALDPFPYNGTTTTCEALWMGVPVITLHGNRHAARVGASIMHYVGLEDLVTYSKEEYIELAAVLARDRQRLADLRRSQRARMRESQLMDKALFTSTLEHAYRQIWREWCTNNRHG